jgi:aspartate 1-decarboxylase
LEASGILENEQVNVYNINNAARFTTYAIKAPRGSKMMGANGACARMVSPGDRVIICTYASFDENEWQGFEPTVLFLDEKNNFKKKI